MKSCMKLCCMIDVRSPDNVRTLNGHLKDMLCPLGKEGVYTSDDFTSNSCIEKKKTLSSVLYYRSSKSLRLMICTFIYLLNIFYSNVFW